MYTYICFLFKINIVHVVDGGIAIQHSNKRSSSSRGSSNAGAAVVASGGGIGGLGGLLRAVYQHHKYRRGPQSPEWI